MKTFFDEIVFHSYGKKEPQPGFLGTSTGKFFMGVLECLLQKFFATQPFTVKTHHFLHGCLTSWPGVGKELDRVPPNPLILDALKRPFMR